LIFVDGATLTLTFPVGDGLSVVSSSTLVGYLLAINASQSGSMLFKEMFIEMARKPCFICIYENSRAFYGGIPCRVESPQRVFNFLVHRGDMLRPLWIVFTLPLLLVPLIGAVKPVQINYDIHSAFEDGESIWFTTKDQGIFAVWPQQGWKEHLVAPGELPANDTTCGVRALGRLWLGTEDGLFYSDLDSFTWSRVSDGELPSTKITCLAAGGGTLWVGTPKGVARLEDGSWTTYTKADGLGGDWVMDIEIHGGEAWFGTLRGGVSRYIPAEEAWQVWGRADGLVSDRVFSVSRSDSHAFVATANGFSVLDTDSNEFTNYGSDQLPSSSVTCCTWCEGCGQAWVGTGRGIAIWKEGEENLTLIEKVGEVELGRINGLEILGGVIWAMRSNTEWFLHLTTGVLGFDPMESEWIRPTFLDILIDQSGYSPGHPKRFVVQCNKRLEKTGSFRVLSGAGKEVYSGSLEERVDREDWDAYYWRGDFTGLELRGNFSIEVGIGGTSGVSYRFEIDNDVLLEECGELVYDFLSYMKCGVTIPGYRPRPCHLDDAVLPNGTHIDATGGWHCAGLWGGKYSEYHTYVLFNLLFALDMRPSFFGTIDRDGDDLPDILNHAMWGCDFLLKMQAENGSIYHEVEKIEVTDGVVGSNDDRPISGWMPIHNGFLAVAGLAGTSALVEDRYPSMADRYLDGALTSFRNYNAVFGEVPRSSIDAAAAVVACFQLHRATGNGTYLELAERYCNMTLGMPYSEYYGPFIPAALGHYLEVYPGTDYWQEIRDYIIGHAINGVSSRTAPAEILRPFDVPFIRNYQNDPRAVPALLAYNYTGNITYLEHGLRIIDFHLGVNPYGLCMLEGTGTRNPLGYACDFQAGQATDNPYTVGDPENPGGAHPGAIPQGPVLVDGRPFMSLGTNPETRTGETWLINTHFLQPIVLIPADSGEYPMEVTEGTMFCILVLLSVSLICAQREA